jgi:hypothetical protein
METQDQEVREAFKSWCARHGYTARRSVGPMDPVGSVALRRSRGRYSVEVATPLAPEQRAVIASGATHGYAYPLISALPKRALAFFRS